MLETIGQCVLFSLVFLAFAWYRALKEEDL